MVLSNKKKRVLFICTLSAATKPGRVSPYAIKVMAEIGIDIGTHRAKSLQEFDYVVTVCNHAKESCPYFPGGKKILHQSFDDPTSLTGTEEEIMAGQPS
jgi:arsenate reductase